MALGRHRRPPGDAGAGARCSTTRSWPGRRPPARWRASATARRSSRCSRWLGDPDRRVRQARSARLNSIGHPEMAARILALLTTPIRSSANRRCESPATSATRNASTHPCSRADPDEVGVRPAAALEHSAVCSTIPARCRRARRRSTDDSAARASGSGSRARPIDDPATRLRRYGALDDHDPWVRYFALRSLGSNRAAERRRRASWIGCEHDPRPRSPRRDRGARRGCSRQTWPAAARSRSLNRPTP